jgi:hypothetical protein
MNARHLIVLIADDVLASRELLNCKLAQGLAANGSTR